MRGPDIAVVFNSEIPPDFEGTYQEIAPAIAIEVAFPSDQPSEIEEKIDDYLRAGVRRILYFFPSNKTKTVWIDGAGRERIVLGVTDVIDCSDLLPGLPPFSIARIFR